MMRARDPRGFTLTELLITVVVASVMVLAFATPFVAERIFWNQGKQQAEAQRDAQLALHAIARTVRECDSATVTSDSALTTLTVACPCGTVNFQGGTGTGQLTKTDQCLSPAAAIVLIDGTRSRVQEFTASYADRLLYLKLQIQYKDHGTETLETRVLLRNAS